jgi:ribosome recycling factor
MAYDFTPLKKKITETEEWLKREFTGIRTGRAAPAILDNIRVDSYGSKLPLNQVGNISIEDARTIRISPWDSSMIKEVEKAISAANLGISAAVDDKGIRVSFPELTSERRESLMKLAKNKLEEARITLRGLRDEIWNDIQKKEKDGEMSEDDKFRGKEEMQKAIDAGNKNFEALLKKKESEIAE